MIGDIVVFVYFTGVIATWVAASAWLYEYGDICEESWPVSLFFAFLLAWVWPLGLVVWPVWRGAMWLREEMVREKELRRQQARDEAKRR